MHARARVPGAACQSGRQRMSWRWAAAAAAVCCWGIGGAGALDNGLGGAPALGWASWNFFTYDINETITLQIGAALVSTGLRDAGFRYVNIDAGSLQRTRGHDGKIAPDPAKFPRGMRYLSDRLHSMGLLFGVYTDLSDGSCGTGPGSKGHYTADAETFANDWEIDYLKVDYCGPWDGEATALEDSCAAGQMCMAGQPDLRHAQLTMAEAVEWCGHGGRSKNRSTSTVQL